MMFTKKATEATERYYPGGMGRMYIVNTPWIFKACWVLAKGWIDEKTRSRISVCDENHIDVLTKIIDIKYIPKWAGGLNDNELIDDIGPWNEYELVDGH